MGTETGTDAQTIDRWEEGGDDERRKGGAAPAWLISVGAHCLAIAVMAAVVFATKPVIDELPPWKSPLLDAQEKKPVEPKKQSVLDPQPSIPVPDEAEVSNPVTTIEPTVELTTSQNDAPELGSEGRTDAVSNMEMGSHGFTAAIGANSGAAGMFSPRKGGAKFRVTGKHGDHGRTSSVASALRWFKRHQSPNGMWDVDGYQANCLDGAAKCEPGKVQAGDADVACTGYALLCYLGAGYDHRTPNLYRKVVENGIKWLLSVQKADGLLGERNYEHAIAATALAEAYAMTNDAQLREPAQKAVDIVLARQAHDAKAKDPAYAGLGWDYVAANPARNDSSVTGWNVMALKSALAGGLNVRNGMSGAKAWLEQAWKTQNPGWQKLDPYQGQSFFPYVYDATAGTTAGNGAGDAHLACIGAVCAIFLGHHAGDLMLETLCNTIMKTDLPAAYPCNTYFLYYNTMALFQVGGKRWDTWNERVATMLAKAQRNDENSCFNGSWDFEGTKFHGHETGRLLSTAYCCLTQEVIWRFVQVGGEKAP
jgi:hypothetical protein